MRLGKVAAIALLAPAGALPGWLPLEAFARDLGGSLGAAIPRQATHTEVSSPGSYIDEAAAIPANVANVAAVSDVRADKKKPSRGRHPSRSKKAASPASARTLFVGARTVLRIANSGVVPEGRPVPATADHPAGISLSAVASLGVGLQDGDVLTHVEGVPVTAQDEIVRTVIALRARHAAVISGRFFRGGEPWALVVEMPYPGERTPDAP